MFFTLLRLLPIILLLVLEAEGTLTFEASTQSHMWRLMSLRSRTTASMAVPCPAISLHEAKRERVRFPRKWSPSYVGYRQGRSPPLSRCSSGSCPERIGVLFILACSACIASRQLPLIVSRNATHVSCPRPAPSSRVVPSDLCTTKKAEPPIEINSTLNTSGVAASHTAWAVV